MIQVKPKDCAANWRGRQSHAMKTGIRNPDINEKWLARVSANPYTFVHGIGYSPRVS